MSRTDEWWRKDRTYGLDNQTGTLYAHLTDQPAPGNTTLVGATAKVTYHPWTPGHPAELSATFKSPEKARAVLTARGYARIDNP